MKILLKEMLLQEGITSTVQDYLGNKLNASKEAFRDAVDYMNPPSMQDQFGRMVDNTKEYVSNVIPQQEEVVQPEKVVQPEIIPQEIINQA